MIRDLLTDASRVVLTWDFPQLTARVGAVRIDGGDAGHLEWIPGLRPELHFDGGDVAARIRLARLRSFVLEGRFEGAQESRLVHVGSPTGGVVEVGEVQFSRELRTRRRFVLDADSKTVLAPLNGRAELGYYRSSECDFGVSQLLELLLVEAFCRLFLSKHPFRSALPALDVYPRIGTSLSSHPAVRAAAVSDSV